VSGRSKLEEIDRPETPLTPALKSAANYVTTLPEVWAKIRRVLLSPWPGAVLLLTLVIVSLAYQFAPALYIKLGGGYDRPYLNLTENGFSAYSIRYDYDDGQSLLVADNRQTRRDPFEDNYRWTRSRPIILLPGLGEGAHLRLEAAASPVYPQGQQVEVLLNGQPFTSFQLQPGAPKQYDFDLTQSQYPRQNGNLAIEMRVKGIGPLKGEVVYVPIPGTDPTAYTEKLVDKANPDEKSVVAPWDGFRLYSVEVTPKAGGIVPPLGTLLALLLTVLSFYFALAYCGLRGRWSFVAAGLLSLGAGVMLAFWREELTVFTGRLALLTFVAAFLLPLLDLSLPRLFRRWKLTLPKWAWTGLLAFFLAGLLLRGGILYPQALVIDSPYHLLQTDKVAKGQLWEQYTNRDLSKVPGQWQSEAVIPYSTITYFLLAPIAKLPIDPAVSLTLFNVLLDALRVFIIYALALALGTGARAALVGAGVYLFIPCTWLLVSWGNWPTTISFWLGVLYLTLALVLYRELNRKRVWYALTALLTLTMLVYSVTAVFMAMLLYLWAAGLFFVTGRRDKVDRRNAKLIALSATVAGLLATGLYYCQFLPDLYKTLTSFDKSLSSGAGLGLGQRDFLPYLWLYTDHVFNAYGVGVLLGLALSVWGWAIFAPTFLKWQPSEGQEVAESDLRSGRNLWFSGAWLAVFVVFGAAQWKVDMVDKQVWFVVPLVCALAGVALLFGWEKLKRPALRYGSQFAIVALTGWLSYSTVTLWIYRIFFKRH
jgi:hypothetical protein